MSQNGEKALPWSVEHRAILDGNGKTIAAGHVNYDTCMEKDYADAAEVARYIVAVVNNHGALVKALETLLEEAENFSVSGVCFNEKCMGHKGPALAHAALAREER